MAESPLRRRRTEATWCRVPCAHRQRMVRRGGGRCSVMTLSCRSCSTPVPGPSVLLFAVGDDVNEILIVQVASHVRRESCKHLLYLQRQRRWKRLLSSGTWCQSLIGSLHCYSGQRKPRHVYLGASPRANGTNSLVSVDPVALKRSISQNRKSWEGPAR